MEKLAELYRKQGLVSDARSMLLQAAEAYTRKGQSKETLRLLKQLVLFDPENVQVITRTADLMNQGGQKNEAKEMLAQTASTLVERHALEPAQKILDRLIALDRDNLRAQELRAQVTFELGDSEKAAELYEAIPDLDSRVDGLRNLLLGLLEAGQTGRRPAGRPQADDRASRCRWRVEGSGPPLQGKRHPRSTQPLQRVFHRSPEPMTKRR